MITNLQPFLQTAWEKAGFQQYTDVQKSVIPLILEGKDVIAESPTGTGKTLAYLLPLLHKVNPAIQNPQIVILSPTRELVMQIHSEVQKFTEGSGITGASLIGGADIKRQVERLKKHPQVITGSPGRVQELIRMKKLKMHEVTAIVFDEFDQMIKQDVSPLLADIIKSTVRSRELLFFSATIPKAIEDKARAFTADPEVVRIKQRAEAAGRVKHLYISGEYRDKLENVRKIVHMDGVKAIAFLNDPFRLDEMASKLQFRKVAAGVVHSEATKQERAATLRDFRNGKIQVLLATDVAARGLDIEGVTHVIHLDFPNTVDQYIHRSGRTGRMGKEGTVISVVTTGEEQKLLQFAKKLGIQFEKMEIYKGDFVTQKPPAPKKKQSTFPGRKQTRS
jgi:superfamily II DNA/RNA helicase